MLVSTQEINYQKKAVLYFMNIFISYYYASLFISLIICIKNRIFVRSRFNICIKDSKGIKYTWNMITK